MRRWIVCISLCLLLQHSAPVQGETSDTQSLLSRSGWARFRIVLGRIEVANIHSSQTRTNKSSDETVGLCEKLTISGDTDIPSVRYQRVTPETQTTITVINGSHVEIAHTRAEASGGSIQFKQQPGGGVLLRIGNQPHRLTYRAPTIWHLMISEPEAAGEHLLPLLTMLQPRWKLDKLLEDAKNELIREANTSTFSLRRTARKLVDQLNNQDFSTRQLAQRQLRELGVGILPYLTQLSPDELTREQRRRIGQVLNVLHSKEADSPKRLALWLVEDDRIWLAMLGSNELAMRRIAANHLAKRFARPIDYNPEAALLERTQQIARIRTQIDRH